MKSNALKHRIVSVMLSGMIMVAMMAVPAPVYAAEIELPINEAEIETESIWEKVAESESETPEVALRTKETLFEKSTNERIVNILPEEEEETEEAVNYIPRLEAPERSNPYFHELNLYYRFGLGMPNCTAYAYGRAYEILGRDPELCNGNAGRWWGHNIASGKYAYGSEPRLGAIACWDNFDGNNGHVSVVEAIDGDRVTISESQWGGKNFYVTDMNADGSDYLTGRRFLGYIYIDMEL